MKKVALVFFVGLAMIGRAQEVREYTDEELTTYATVMAWADDQKGNMTDTYNGWINNDELLEAARFVKIRNAKGDSLKLQAIEASNDEVLAFEKIQVSYDSMIASFTEVYKGKIKEEIGAGLYNSLRKDLKKDEELKVRYTAIFEQLKSAAVTEESDTEE